MTTTPYCNVTVATPPAKPGAPQGFTKIPSTATLQQVIHILNQNFNSFPQVFLQQFNSQGMPLINKAIADALAKLNFKQVSLQTQKVRVENPDDPSQFIVDVRVKKLVMRDTTGASWTYNGPVE